MASIDWARAYLTEGAGGAAYRAVAAETARLRAQINKRGVFRAPVRSGRRFPRPHPADGGHGPRWFVRRPGREHLEQDYNIWPEMTDRDRVVCILTCADTAEELERLGERPLRRWSSLQRQRPSALSAAAGAPDAPAYSGGRVCTPAHAFALNLAAGCVSASSIAPYPPGVSVVAPGKKLPGKL